MDVTGDVVLDGTLEIRFIDGFVPQTGDNFQFLTCQGAVSGAFDRVEVSGLPDGTGHEVTTSGGSVQMAVSNSPGNSGSGGGSACFIATASDR